MGGQRQLAIATWACRPYRANGVMEDIGMAGLRFGRATRLALLRFASGLGNGSKR